MNVHTSYKNLQKTPDLEREINQQTEKLKKRLQVFRPELVHLRATIEENNVREGFTVSVDLKLPSGDVAARQSADSAASAIKTAFDQLTEQVSKHKNHLRAEWKWPRRRKVGRNRPSPQVPFENGLQQTVEWYRDNQWWWRPIKEQDAAYKAYIQTQYGARR